jgi:hypothetical protein
MTTASNDLAAAKDRARSAAHRLGRITMDPKAPECDVNAARLESEKANAAYEALRAAAAS